MMISYHIGSTKPSLATSKARLSALFEPLTIFQMFLLYCESASASGAKEIGGRGLVECIVLHIR